MKNRLNMSTIGAFGGRGMGQTCGVADPSQWMRVFGVDIDSRDTTDLLETAEGHHRRPSWPRPASGSSRSSASRSPTARRPTARSASTWPQEDRRAGGLGLLHHPVLPRAGRRLQRHLLRAEHDAGRRRRHLHAERLQHRHDRQAADRPEQRAGLLRRPAAHRQGATTRSRSSATAPARPRWPASWARRGSPSTASPPRARPAGCRWSWSASRARACWPAWARRRRSSRWSSPAARSSSRRPSELEAPQAGVRHPVLAARLRHGPLRHRGAAGGLEQRVRRAWATARTSTTTCSPSAS